MNAMRSLEISCCAAASGDAKDEDEDEEENKARDGRSVIITISVSTLTSELDYGVVKTKFHLFHCCHLFHPLVIEASSVC